MDKPAALPRIRKSQTLEEMAYQQIKQAVINGVFAPGSFLAEVHLAEELGISKTPVRKALGRLHQEQFLTNVPFAGYHVAEISMTDILEVYQLREILECFVVERTVGTFNEDELDAMTDALRKAGAALDRVDHVAFVEFNRQFHHTFDRKYNSQRISTLLDNLDEHVQRILVYLLPGEKLELQTSHNEHYGILQAVIAGDADSAVDQMRGHLGRFRDVLIARQQRQAQLEKV